MPRVVVTDATFTNLDRERAAAVRHGAQFEEARCSSESEVITAATGADVLVVQFAKITRQCIERLARGAAIIRYGIGLDNIDLVAARERGLKVAYVPDYATGEVADHTVALILTALRKIIPLDRAVREGVWDAVGVARPVRSFSESIVGFIGFGRIGREVFARLKPFGFGAIVADPFADSATLADIGVQCVDVDTLVSTADVVTLHAPLTDATRHIVNMTKLLRMKSSTVIINTARGGLIDPAALEQALLQRHIAGAALDVFEEEPLPASSGLRRIPNVILTPHAAWYSSRAVEKLQALVADEVDRHLSGLPARCPAPYPA
jgi:D-3-phosphoglycerate dehydrogenase / 2-oxoglutarate reductase